MYGLNNFKPSRSLDYIGMRDGEFLRVFDKVEEPVVEDEPFEPNYTNRLACVNV
jgi:hypothetical protein